MVSVDGGGLSPSIVIRPRSVAVGPAYGSCPLGFTTGMIFAVGVLMPIHGGRFSSTGLGAADAAADAEEPDDGAEETAGEGPVAPPPQSPQPPRTIATAASTPALGA